jgi:hypothetical protein
MGHQYLEDVICRSNLLYDREKLDILRQQLKAQNKKPGMYKVGKRILQPMDVMTNHRVSTIRNNYVQDRCIYSMKVRMSSNAVLLGLYLNIEDCTGFRSRVGSVISSISPMESLGDGSMDKDFTTRLREMKENFVELYPRFFIPLRKGVMYTVSVRFDDASRYSKLKLGFKNKPQDACNSCEFNGKELTVCGWSNDPLIEGFRLNISNSAPKTL